ncbi:hypothetical protein SMALB_4777 [Streptomyces malaysiensis]|uniref:Uncharacterized protein n=1 Tax=Streptomyces malaysiensis TaxID=92644 RepID=A0A7X5X549_STRMQ|nr:hypothetical protein [Streptomyces malaysiensis]
MRLCAARRRVPGGLRCASWRWVLDALLWTSRALWLLRAPDRLLCAAWRRVPGGLLRTPYRLAAHGRRVPDRRCASDSCRGWPGGSPTPKVPVAMRRSTGPSWASCRSSRYAPDEVTARPTAATRLTGRSASDTPPWGGVCRSGGPTAHLRGPTSASSECGSWWPTVG